MQSHPMDTASLLTWHLCLARTVSGPGYNAKCMLCSTKHCRCLQNLGSLEQVALEIDGGGTLSPGSGYGSGGGFGSTGGSLTSVV